MRGGNRYGELHRETCKAWAQWGLMGRERIGREGCMRVLVVGSLGKVFRCMNCCV